jgi:hypothetical protein
MIGRDMRVLIRYAALCVATALAACNQSPPGPLHKVDRVAKAEAAMTECKKRVGLDEVATPTGMVLDDPATRGQEMTPEMAGQLRLKVQCALELNELLAARRDAQ